MNQIKPKGTAFSKGEEKSLLKIQRGPNQKLDLLAFCNKYGRVYALAYAKWNTLLKKKANPLMGIVGNKRKYQHRVVTPVVSVPFTSPKEIAAYTLVDAVLGHGRGSKHATQIILDKLDPLVNMLEPDKYSVPFFRENRGVVRKWLSSVKEGKDRVYNIVPIRGNQKMMAIQRKA